MLILAARATQICSVLMILLSLGFFVQGSWKDQEGDGIRVAQSLTATVLYIRRGHQCNQEEDGTWTCHSWEPRLFKPVSADYNGSQQIPDGSQIPPGQWGVKEYVAAYFGPAAELLLFLFLFYVGTRQVKRLSD